MPISLSTEHAAIARNIARGISTRCKSIAEGLDGYGREIGALVRPLSPYRDYALSCQKNFNARKDQYGNVALFDLKNMIDDECLALEKIHPAVIGYDAIADHAVLLRRKTWELLQISGMAMDSDTQEDVRFIDDVAKELVKNVKNLHHAMDDIQEAASDLQEWQKDVLECDADDELKDDRMAERVDDIRWHYLSAIAQGYNQCDLHAKRALNDIQAIRESAGRVGQKADRTQDALNPQKIPNPQSPESLTP